MPGTLVAITTDRRDAAVSARLPAHGRVRPPRPEVFLGEALVQAVRAAGGVPLLLPPGELAPRDLSRILDAVSAVLVSGGAFDIHPRHYGQPVQGRLDRTDEGRTGLELALCRACLERGMPVLGICGGMQALAVAAGGSLIQDIGSQVPGALAHEQAADPVEPSHAVALVPGRLSAMLGSSALRVNSTHHQAVADPGALRVVGRSPDGVIEAAEHPELPAVGVQWHPELLGQGALFRWLLGRS